APAPSAEPSAKAPTPMPTAAPVLIRASAVVGAAVNATPAASAVAKAKPLPIVVLAMPSSIEEPHHSSAAAKPGARIYGENRPGRGTIPAAPQARITPWRLPPLAGAR